MSTLEMDAATPGAIVLNDDQDRWAGAGCAYTFAMVALFAVTVWAAASLA
jgi:hypothetical protein